MSRRPPLLEPAPEDTARATRAAFPKGDPYLTLRDQLGTIFQDEDFAALFPAWGQPGLVSRGPYPRAYAALDCGMPDIAG